MFLDLAHRLRRILFSATGLQTRGVRVMLFDATGRVLLIRHGYGDRAGWLFPGGGLRRRETPAAGAVREVREEVGCAIAGLTPVGVFASTAEGWRDMVHLFRATTTDVPAVDGWEVKEACFFALDALPRTTTPATAKRLAELQGGPVPADW